MDDEEFAHTLKDPPKKQAEEEDDEWQEVGKGNKSSIIITVSTFVHIHGLQSRNNNNNYYYSY